MESSSLRVRVGLALAAGLLVLAAAGGAPAGWEPGRDPRAAASAVPSSAPFSAASGAGAGQPALMERLMEQSAPLRAAGAPTLQRERLDGLRAPAALHAVAIMVEFADTCFYGRQHLFPGDLPTSTQSSFYYAAHDSLYYAHLLQDVADYYTAVSGGRFSLEVVVHGRVVELAEGMAHYGNHPEHGEQPFLLAAEAVAALDGEVDFSAYDTVILIHAGAGQETDVLRNSPEQIYSTYLGPDAFRWAVEDSVVAQPYLPAGGFGDGDGVRHVLILPETQFQDPYEGFSGHYGSLGTYCFVVGLRLGMLSLSDFTPAGAPDSQGVGQFCLMGYGLFSAGGYVPPHPCAFNKQLMGWLEPFVVDPGLGASWTLYPSEFPDQPQAAARIDLTGAEYFLLEYRLQDPDGNGIFSFTGDLNGNNVPDFYDMSNAAGGGVPVGFFDPETDIRERFTGAEWDFFLSDNPARAPGVKGAGSGLYVWHIDEGVIRDAFGRRQNLFNADPRRKSVDLEEADGIQDLDTRQPSPYWLGGDDDSFRGEGNDTFGPDTRPDTRTNGGVRTGLVIDQISRVVADSTHVYHVGTDSAYTGILYAEAMTFRCRREAPDGAGPTLLAARDLPGVDMTGSHLLVASLDGDLGGGQPVFVAAADSGRVYAWTADLAEWVDHDGDPGTFEPLAIGTGEAGQPVAWLPPAAAGRFDPAVPGLEIVLASPEGLYAFHQDGTPLASGPGTTARGRVAALPILLAPVLLPLAPAEELAATVVACIVTAGPAERTAAAAQPASQLLRFIDRDGAEAAPAVALPGRATAPPVRHGHVLYVPIETADGGGALVAVRFGLEQAVLWQQPLDLVPGPHPPLVAAWFRELPPTGRLSLAEPAPPDPLVILVTDADGRGQTVVWHLSTGQRSVGPLWPTDVVVAGPLGPGGAFNGPQVLGRVGASGAPQSGWPRRPQPAVQAGAAQPLGIGPRVEPGGGLPAADLHLLFATRDGRLYLTGADGRTVPGWPLAGPADLQATPAAVTLARGTAGERLLVMVAGTTPQIAGLIGGGPQDGGALLTAAVTRLRSWEWPTAGTSLQIPPIGAMYGGSPWRGEVVASLTGPSSIAAEPLARSHVCYPQPLVTAMLRVRGEIAFAGRARAVILNLQGQKVRDTGEVPVLGGGPFELEIDMQGVASGLYICRLEAGGQTSVRTIAVAR